MFVPERQRFGSQVWKRPVRVHQYLRDTRQEKYPQVTLEKEAPRKVEKRPGTCDIPKAERAQ